VETVVPLGQMPNGTMIDLTAAFGDGMENADSITLGCHAYECDAIAVQFEPGGESNPRLRTWFHEEFPSEEASGGGTDRS
jgi:hypothetical protein